MTDTEKLVLNTNQINEDLFFPPSWNMNDYPEKTEGWIAFQISMKANPKYYLEEFLIKDREKLAIAINLLKALDSIMKSHMEDGEDIRWAGMVYMTDFITCTLEQIEGNPCETPKENDAKR